MLTGINRREGVTGCIVMILAAALVLLAGCGGSPSSAPAATSPSNSAPLSTSTIPPAPLPATNTGASPAISSTLPTPNPTATSSPKPTLPVPSPSASAKAPAELAYDDGIADGWISSGGQQQYGYLVRFTPGLPYSISKIRIFSYLPQAAQNDPQFSLRITDKNLASRWDSSFPYTMFSASAAWLEIPVPAVAVESEFCVLLYAPTLGKDLGPFLGVDTSSANTHSQVIAAWALSEWTAGIPKEKANWMIRVGGN